MYWLYNKRALSSIVSLLHRSPCLRTIQIFIGKYTIAPQTQMGCLWLFIEPLKHKHSGSCFNGICRDNMALLARISETLLFRFAKPWPNLQNTIKRTMDHTNNICELQSCMMLLVLKHYNNIQRRFNAWVFCFLRPASLALRSTHLKYRTYLSRSHHHPPAI